MLDPQYPAEQAVPFYKRALGIADILIVSHLILIAQISRTHPLTETSICRTSF